MAAATAAVTPGPERDLDGRDDCGERDERLSVLQRADPSGDARQADVQPDLRLERSHAGLPSAAGEPRHRPEHDSAPLFDLPLATFEREACNDTLPAGSLVATPPPTFTPSGGTTSAPLYGGFSWAGVAVSAANFGQYLNATVYAYRHLIPDRGSDWSNPRERHPDDASVRA